MFWLRFDCESSFTFFLSLPKRLSTNQHSLTYIWHTLDEWSSKENNFATTSTVFLIYLFLRKCFPSPLQLELAKVLKKYGEKYTAKITGYSERQICCYKSWNLNSHLHLLTNQGVTVKQRAKQDWMYHFLSRTSPHSFTASASTRVPPDSL